MVCHIKCCHCKELWDGFISFHLGILMEIGKEELKHLSLAFREFEQLLSWLPIRHIWLFHSFLNRPTQKKNIQPQAQDWTTDPRNLRCQCYLRYHTDVGFPLYDKRRFVNLFLQWGCWDSYSVLHPFKWCRIPQPNVSNLCKFYTACSLLTCHSFDLKPWCLPANPPLEGNCQIQQCTSSSSSTNAAQVGLMPPTKTLGRQEFRFFSRLASR